MARNILVTGGTGFIGRELCAHLLARGDRVAVFSRQDSDTVRALCGKVEPVAELASLRGHAGFDAVINLAGEGIAERRWSEARKRRLRDSRIGLTTTLVDTITTWQRLPQVLVSGSAVGYYGDQGENTVTENTAPRDEFTHRLCRDWEQAALALAPRGVRVCLSRTGLVVGSGGGFLARMLPPFRLGLGGRLGSGRQYMPWVHRWDVVAALIWMVDQSPASGPYNVVAPTPVTNRSFTRTLGRVLHRPALFPVPTPVLKLGFGEMARLLLTGQRAVPERLLAEGFQFRFTELAVALEEALHSIRTGHRA
ncbi:TIGR01777 family oxidoreductase [Marinobacter lutaoensis]|jgi:uncharacterized protein (TIGR01777 family)|uniref:TIGR01777 family protein n=1 Tax=Marinobacter lutaoensis TaxID=135739 RepID=A0A1V2DTF2_9GAMM|nr:TIGR01777 family oxidoreductase [Marinobacter lutaoensis]NVD35044.1 TIGR01777 family protein [Marinobacter lutaoensis]ONF44005.1 TIGR01777 family protein [Marinobacter lutaoensis]